MYQQYRCIVPSAITICTATTVLKVHQLQYFTATTAPSPSVPNCTKLCQFTAPSASEICTKCTIYHYLNYTSALHQVYQPYINAQTATVPSIPFIFYRLYQLHTECTLQQLCWDYHNMCIKSTARHQMHQMHQKHCTGPNKCTKSSTTQQAHQMQIKETLPCFG